MSDSPVPEPATLSEPVYPGTWLRFPKADDPELPEEGEITFRYCVRRKSIETQGDATKVEYSIDLKAITGAAVSTTVEKTKSAEEALDDLAKAIK